MRIGITGASGLVGSRLRHFLQGLGHSIQSISLRMNPSGTLSTSTSLENLDALVHLSGAGLADQRWSEQRKQEIRQSRVDLSQALVQALLNLQKPPKVLIASSAVGFYPQDGQIHTEISPRGAGFLAELCEDWENAIRPLQSHIRICHLRLGVVLDPEGGALQKMLPAFRLGLGGRIGNGQQGFSWISSLDLCRLIEFLIFNHNAHGVFNAVANALPQADFARQLGQGLGRPSLFPLPAFLVKILFGEMGQEMLLQGCYVRSERLSELDFTFRDTQLGSYFEELFRGQKRH